MICLQTLNGDEAPAPPVRGSSKRDLEARFADLFNPPSLFPNPDPFLRIAKGYSSATVAGKYSWDCPRPRHRPLLAPRGRHFYYQLVPLLRVVL